MYRESQYVCILGIERLSILGIILDILLSFLRSEAVT